VVKVSVVNNILSGHLGGGEGGNSKGTYFMILFRGRFKNDLFSVSFQNDSPTPYYYHDLLSPRDDHCTESHNKTKSINRKRTTILLFWLAAATTTSTACNPAASEQQFKPKWKWVPTFGSAQTPPSGDGSLPKSPTSMKLASMLPRTV